MTQNILFTSSFSTGFSVGDFNFVYFEIECKFDRLTYQQTEDIWMLWESECKKNNLTNPSIEIKREVDASGLVLLEVFLKATRTQSLIDYVDFSETINAFDSNKGFIKL